jgi:hypothetical protein
MTPRTAVPPSERVLYSQLRLALRHPGLLRGSLVEMRRTCGKKPCRCLKGRRFRHRSTYLAVRLRGKSRLIYVPAEWEDRVRDWVARYGRVREVLEQLSQACLARLQQRET